MKFDNVLDYHKQTNRAQRPGRSIQPIFSYLSFALARPNSTLFASLFNMGIENKRLLMAALLIGDGRAVQAALEETGIAKIIMETLQHHHPDGQYTSDELGRIIEHSKSSSSYLNDASLAIIRVMLEPFDNSGLSAEFIKDVIKSIPDEAIGLQAKRSMVLQISKHAFNAMTDYRYSADISNETRPFKARVTPHNWEKQLAIALQQDLDESQFILIMHSVLHTNGANQRLLMQLRNEYHHFEYDTEVGEARNYKRAIELIKLFINDQPETFPLKRDILNKIKVLTRTDPVNNYSRRYYETKMGQYILGSQMVEPQCITSLKKVTKYFRERYQIGISIESPGPFIDLPIDQMMERSILSITDSEHVMGRIVRLKEHLLKRRSTLYKTKSRTYIANSPKDISRGRVRDVDDKYSANIGIMKANQPAYRDEQTEPTFNRSPDIHSFGDEQAWPTIHAEVPYTASLSGHAYFVVGILLIYASDNASDKDLNHDINNFLKGMIASYVKQGLHSIHEIEAVLTEDHIREEFAKYNVTLTFSIFPEILAHSFEHATQYTFDMIQRQAMHKELQEKGPKLQAAASPSPENKRKRHIQVLASKAAYERRKEKLDAMTDRDMSDEKAGLDIEGLLKIIANPRNAKAFFSNPDNIGKLLDGRHFDNYNMILAAKFTVNQLEYLRTLRKVSNNLQYSKSVKLEHLVEETLKDTSPQSVSGLQKFFNDLLAYELAKSSGKTIDPYRAKRIQYFKLLLGLDKALQMSKCSSIVRLSIIRNVMEHAIMQCSEKPGKWAAKSSTSIIWLSTLNEMIMVKLPASALISTSGTTSRLFGKLAITTPVTRNAKALLVNEDIGFELISNSLEAIRNNKRLLRHYSEAINVIIRGVDEELEHLQLQHGKEAGEKVAATRELISYYQAGAKHILMLMKKQIGLQEQEMQHISAGYYLKMHDDLLEQMISRYKELPTKYTDLIQLQYDLIKSHMAAVELQAPMITQQEETVIDHKHNQLLAEFATNIKALSALHVDLDTLEKLYKLAKEFFTIIAKPLDMKPGNELSKITMEFDNLKSLLCDPKIVPSGITEIIRNTMREMSSADVTTTTYQPRTH